jgi:hypothetical protein
MCVDLKKQRTMNIQLKIATLLLLPLLGSLQSHSQNLVPNYSFEEHDTCPDNYNQAHYASHWEKSMESTNPIYHTEYLNSCGTTSFGSPSNVWGYQSPSTGNGYMALSTYAPGSPEHRENIYVQLIAPLVVGEFYTVRMQVSKVDNCKRATDRLGVKLSKSVYFPINNTALLASPTVITNATGWEQLEYTFSADSAYRYLCIGNFFTDANTTITMPCPGCAASTATYYIDDVCLTPGNGGDCSIALTSDNPLGDHASFAVFPNPSRGEASLRVNLDRQSEVSYCLTDVTGRILDKHDCLVPAGQTNLALPSALASGIYFLKVNAGARVECLTFTVQ